jgi:hypothetical protein
MPFVPSYLLAGAGTLNGSKLHGNTRHLLCLDHPEIFSGINKRRQPVICEDVWGNLLSDVMGRK